MKTTQHLLLALGGITASFSMSAALLDSFDTFVAPGSGTRGFDLLLAAPGTVQDNAGSGENVATAPSDTSFASLTRRVTLNHTSGSGNAKFNNNANPGIASWSNDSGVNSTAVLRYNFTAGQNFIGSGLVNIDFDMINPEVGANLTVDIFTGSSPNYLGAYLTGSFANAFLTTNPSFSVPSFTGVNGGTYASIWSSARTIVFTLSSGLTDRDLSIDEINLTQNNVPEAQTMIPAVGLAGLVGLVAWKRRKSN